MSDPAPIGIFLVDKPAGPTSHDVVALIRRRVGRTVKVGHAGTLDPFATGLLVVAVGRATRLLRFIVGHDKTYVARVRLGATSETGDPEGPIVASDRPLPSAEQIAAAVADLPAMTTQRTPVYSAVKVDGVPMHRRVRRGETVVADDRTIAIREAALIGTDPARTWFDLRVTCSAGTYIRQLAVDLGDALGCGGYCETLRRTAVGALDIADAVSPDAVPDAGAIDPVAALAPMATRTLADHDLIAVTHGRPIPDAGSTGPATVALLDRDGGLAAVAETRDGLLRPVVVLR